MKLLLLIILINISFAKKEWVEKYSYFKNGYIGQSAGIHCSDSSNCYNFVDNDIYTAVQKSSDQGETWEDIFVYNGLENKVVSAFGIIESCVYDFNKILIGFKQFGILFKSIDGVNTFDIIDLEIGQNDFINHIEMRDSQNGALIAKQGKFVFITQDNWKTYERRDYEFFGIFRSFKYLNDSTLIIPGGYASQGNGIWSYGINNGQWKKIFSLPVNGIKPNEEVLN